MEVRGVEVHGGTADYDDAAGKVRDDVALFSLSISLIKIPNHWKHFVQLNLICLPAQVIYYCTTVRCLWSTDNYYLIELLCI